VVAVAGPRFQLVAGARLSGAVDGGGVGWRLLGANNRELGRSAVSYDDAESALAALARVRDLAVSGQAHIVHHAGFGHWEWHLDDADAPVATSGRRFRHERECRYNLEQFRESAPSAPASDTTAPMDFAAHLSLLAAAPESVL
jgi:hypothetical protein